MVPRAWRLVLVTESPMSMVAPWAAICCCPAMVKLLYPAIVEVVVGTLTCCQAAAAPVPVFEELTQPIELPYVFPICCIRNKSLRGDRNRLYSILGDCTIW